MGDFVPAGDAVYAVWADPSVSILHTRRFAFQRPKELAL